MWPALPWFKEPLFVRWISQLITVTVACLAAWKLPNFLAILLPPHLHMLKPLNPSPFQTELGRVAAPCAPSCADQQGLAMSLPSASLKTIPFPSTGKVQKHPDTRGPCSPATPSQEILKNHIQMHPNTKQEWRNVVQLRGAKPRASVGAILNSGLVRGFFFLALEKYLWWVGEGSDASMAELPPDSSESRSCIWFHEEFQVLLG